MNIYTWIFAGLPLGMISLLGNNDISKKGKTYTWIGGIFLIHQVVCFVFFIKDIVKTCL